MIDIRDNYADVRCIHCGEYIGLHHFATMQCPRGGEAPIGEKQQWLSTVYTPDVLARR